MKIASIPHERLAAFADGELSPEEAAEVVMYLADHPEDQALVDEIMAANAALARAFAGPMTEPVSEAIRAVILGPEAQGRAPRAEPARIVPFRRRIAALGGLALAASVAGAAFFLPQGSLRPTGDVLAIVPGPLAAGSDLLRAVTVQPSGQTVRLGNAELTVLASMPLPEGHCREAEVIDRPAGLLTVALICDRGAGWGVEVALTEPLPGNVTDFVPAGGDETEALGLWLDRLGAGMALSPEEEAAAIARAWGS